MIMTDSNGTPVRHRTEVINGIRQHFVTAGSGEPLLLVHGFPQTHYAWRKIIAALSERYFVIAPDLRGCGDSERPETMFDKQEVAADLHALLERLGAGSVNLVSHDVGMMVGYAYAATYRDQVRRAVLMEAALPGLGLEDLYDSDAYPRMYHLGLFEAPSGFAEMLITGREKPFVDHFMRQQAANPAALEEDALDEYARRLAAPGGLRGGITYFRTHRLDARHNRQHAQQRLGMPVMTVGGTASFGAALRDQLAPLVQHHRHEMIEDCGHYLAEEQPQRLTELLLDFVGDGKDAR